MRKKFSPVLISFGLLGVLTSCQKGGPDIPYDLPFPTPTPVTGSITVKAIDQTNGSSPVTNLSVSLVDPSSYTYPSQSTDSFGQAAFNPNVLTPGLWTAIVPDQGKFFTSSQTFNVTGGGQQTVTFTAGGEAISIISPGPFLYSTAATNIPITVQYTQGGNLAAPVSLSTTGLINGISASFNPVTLGAGINQSAVTITVPANSFEQPSINLRGTYLDNLSNISSQSVVIERNFSIQLVASITWGAESTPRGGNTNCPVTIVFSTVNGINVNWSGPITIGGTSSHLSSSNTNFTGMETITGTANTGFLSNGGNVYIGFSLTAPNLGTATYPLTNEGPMDSNTHTVSNFFTQSY